VGRLVICVAAMLCACGGGIGGPQDMNPTIRDTSDIYLQAREFVAAHPPAANERVVCYATHCIVVDAGVAAPEPALPELVEQSDAGDAG
jgi:hypothetical protein